jgi:hypothetical protein
MTLIQPWPPSIMLDCIAGAPPLHCCAAVDPQQRQLSEGLSPLGLVRLLSDAYALLRKPRKHTCEVQRILPQQLKHLSTEASGSEAAISLSKDATSILTGGYRPVSP